jgi:hypothetical protein
MAIIYPADCRNVSAGALRQVKQKGYTTAGVDGGMWATKMVKVLAADMGGYFRKSEPIGKLMSDLENTAKQVGELQEAIRKGMVATVEAAKVQTKELTDVSGKLRDNAEKLGAAIEKFSKIAGNTNFAESAKQAASLVDSLERLAELQRTGLLDKVMAALSDRR